MSLADQLHTQMADPTYTPGEQARLRLRLSIALEDSGDYEGAREAMGELWPGLGVRPALDGLDQRTAAEVLLRMGVLTSCLGSAKQVQGAQEAAKNLITESITRFESLQEFEKVAEARTDLAVCYWREGASDEARVILAGVLSGLTEVSRVKAVALLRSALIEWSAKRFTDTLRIYNDAAPLFEKIENPALKGNFHAGFALVLRNLGTAERRADYIDCALIEYAAASFHFEQAGHERYCARVENNLGFLYSTLGRFAEAHEHVGRARSIFFRLKDRGNMAQVDDTRAKVLLAEGRHEDAEIIAREAVCVLEEGGEQSLLAEALTTHGIALARMNRHLRARLTLGRAVVVAEQAGDRESAGLAALSIVEELGAHSAPSELNAAYERAVELLANSQHSGVKDRLLACASALLRAPSPPPVPSTGPGTEFDAPADWEGFSFREEMVRYERVLIEQALKDAGGSVSRAAQLLGFKHHYSLSSLINQRHKNLLESRSPVVPRRRSIFRVRNDAPSPLKERAIRAMTILHVEDNKMVADAVKDLLESEGWSVEVCMDGAAALKKVTGNFSYDLLLFDNDVPGVNGLELVRAARKLSHRRRTPIIMLSAGDCETEAWRAGVNAFLHKPEDIYGMADTVARLLHADEPER